jgi:hypothetical protein
VHQAPHFDLLVDLPRLKAQLLDLTGLQLPREPRERSPRMVIDEGFADFEDFRLSDLSAYLSDLNLSSSSTRHFLREFA